MISVIIPTFNRKDMLYEAINNVLQQENVEIQIVIVDDNSTDGTEQMILAYKSKYDCIKYLKNNKNMGPGYNRNLGYRESSGDYIVFMDDDDCYIDNKFFKTGVDIMNQSNQVVCVSGNANIENIDTKEVVPSNIGLVGTLNGIKFIENMNIKYNKPQSTFTSIFRRSALDRADIINMKMVNDAAIYLRGLTNGDIYVIEKIIGNYRVHDGNISNQLNSDFMISNLEERLWVSSKIFESRKKRNNWLKNQCLLCYSYFVSRSKPNKDEKKKVFLWIAKHNSFSISFYYAILKIYYFG